MNKTVAEVTPQNCVRLWRNRPFADNVDVVLDFGKK
jgi:hypothetical protein